MAVVFDDACEVLRRSVRGVRAVFVGQRGNVGLVDVCVQVPEHTIIASQCPTDTHLRSVVPDDVINET